MPNNNEKKEILDKYIYEAMRLFKKTNLVFPKVATVSIYHHCGISNIYQTGAMFINVVNRDYSKSYVTMLPGQRYPNHYHKIKIESFYVLKNTLNLVVDGRKFLLKAGECLDIDRGQDHLFETDTGVVFEEISTMYVANDSVYLDKEIKKASYAERRTVIKQNEWKELCEKWK